MLVNIMAEHNWYATLCAIILMLWSGIRQEHVHRKAVTDINRLRGMFACCTACSLLSFETHCWLCGAIAAIYASLLRHRRDLCISSIIKVVLLLECM